MKRYLFFVNQPYSYSILRPLQEVIRRRGDKAAWFVSGCTTAPLRADEMLLETITDVMEYKPDATFAPGDWVPYFFPGIKVEVFHGLARNKRGHGSEEESDHYRIRGWFDLYCTHAEKDTAKFQALAEQHGHFAVAKTGWPKLDPLMKERREQQAASHKKALPTVFFASTFSRSVTAAPALVDTIARLARSGEWHFLVTLHPKMEADTVAAYRELAGENLTYIESDQDLLPILPRADVMLCDTSSIMFEFMFLGKPVVTLNTKMPGPYLIDVSRPEEVESALRQALERPEDLMRAMGELCTELHSFNDGQSSERVLDATEHFLQHQAGRLARKPANIMRKLKVRKRMGYWGRS